MRYYVVSGDREKGPYSVEQLVASLEQGMLTRASLVRGDDEPSPRPLGDLLSSRAAPPVQPAAYHPIEARPVDLRNPYAAPAAEEPLGLDTSLRRPDEGNYWLGFALGFFGGCIALMVMRSSKPQTWKGAQVGFAVSLGITLLRLLANGFH